MKAIIFDCDGVLVDSEKHSVFGIRAARSAHMRAWGFTSSFPAPVLLEAGAHRVFASYREFISSCAPDMGSGNAE